MSFIQIMQSQTSKIDEIRAAVDEWQKATRGQAHRRAEHGLPGPGQPGPLRGRCLLRLLEDAMRNSALPETDALSKKTTALSDGPPTFVNLDIIEERLV